MAWIEQQEASINAMPEDRKDFAWIVAREAGESMLYDLLPAHLKTKVSGRELPDLHRTILGALSSQHYWSDGALTLNEGRIAVETILQQFGVSLNDPDPTLASLLLTMPPPHVLLILAGAVRDAAGVNARPGAVAVYAERVIAAGPVAEVRGMAERSAAEAGVELKVLEIPDRLVLPAMVNAHAHLDLSPMGPRPYPGDFLAWIGMVRREAKRDPASLVEAVRLGAAMSLEAGVGWIGDIASGPTSAAALRDTGLGGVRFLEYFGMWDPADPIAALDPMISRGGEMQSVTEADAATAPLRSRLGGEAAVGLQPHAPYSAGPALYGWCVEQAIQHGLRLSTHLAETHAEIAFTRDAAGPFADLLRGLGKWRESIKPTGLHPVDYLAPFLSKGGSRWTLAHVNYVEDQHPAMLADFGVNVAYCPIASDYFGHRGHPYRKLLGAGVNVCLGTDSILCQPANEPQPLGVLPQIRWLWRRDGTPAGLLLEMATTRGARALGLPDDAATLRPGAQARLMAVAFDPGREEDAWVQALNSEAQAERVACGDGMG